MLPSQILEVVESFSRAVSSFAGTDGSSTARNLLVDAVATINQLRSQHDAVQVLRPNVSSARAISRTLARVALLWDAYKPVLTASTLSESQELSATAQEILDTTGQAIRDHIARADAAAVFDDTSVGNFFERALKALQVYRPGLSLLEIAAVAAAEATQETGVPVADPSGAQYLTLIAVAEVHLDADRFRRVARDAARFCRDNELLRSIAAAPEPIQALVDGNRMYAEAITAFEAILQHEKDETALIRRIIRLHSEIYEGVGLYQFAWYALLAGLKTKPFQKLVEDGATDIARTLLQSEIAPWFEGIDAYLRNAGQHGGAFSIADGQVTFKLKTLKKTMRVDEVIDTVLTFLESLAATSWALTNALVTAGIELPTPEADAEYIGVTKIRMAALSLSDRGEEVLQANEADGTWDLELGGHGGVSPIALALALTKGVNTKEISVRRQGSQEPWLAIPLATYVAHTEMRSVDHSPAELLISLLRVRSGCRRNTGPLVSGNDFKYAIGVLGLFFLSPDLTMVPHLRSVKVLAVEVGDVDAVKLIQRVFLQSRIDDRRGLQRVRSQLNGYVQTLSLSLPEGTRVTVSR